MSHWAEIDKNNIVLRVLVGSNNEVDEGYQWLIDNLGGTWIQTSYTSKNGNRIDPDTNEIITYGDHFRGNYAGIGYIYDQDLDVFFPPQPYPSWKKTENFDWEAPVPMPEKIDGFIPVWDEESVSWQQIAIE